MKKGTKAGIEGTARALGFSNSGDQTYTSGMVRLVPAGFRMTDKILLVCETSWIAKVRVPDIFPRENQVAYGVDAKSLRSFLKTWK